MANWATPKGFNFRSTTSGLGLTDGANEHVVNSFNDTANQTAVAYPVTNTIGGDSVVYGWTVGTDVETRDLSSSVGVHFAGAHFNATATKTDFQVDLPASGSYTIKAAFGYESGGFPVTAEVRDGSNSLFTVSGTTSGADKFFDSNGNQTTSAAWADTGHAVTFTGTTFTLRIGDGVSSTTGFVAYLQITQNASATGIGIFGGN